MVLLHLIRNQVLSFVLLVNYVWDIYQNFCLFLHLGPILLLYLPVCILT
jgi:hypothetical protein